MAVAMQGTMFFPSFKSLNFEYLASCAPETCDKKAPEDTWDATNDKPART